MSESPFDLFRRLYVSGGVVALDNAGTPVLSGRRPPDALLSELKANRDTIATMLQEHRIGQPDPGFSTAPRRYVTPPECGCPRSCARLGPCSRFLTMRPCTANGGGDGA